MLVKLTACSETSAPPDRPRQSQEVVHYARNMISRIRITLPPASWTWWYLLLVTFTSLFTVHSSAQAPVPGIVINEIHYDPDPNTEFVSFIELFNSSTGAINISGWKILNGVDVSFPSNTSLAPSRYLLLAENPAALRAAYPSIPASTAIIQFVGSLKNDGETLSLISSTGLLKDTVDYRAEFPWPVSANGEGASIQLINANLDNDLGGSWRGAEPTPGFLNAVFASKAAPQIRQVAHTPPVPLPATATVITAKISDPDGVASAQLLYQSVAPGSFLPAFLPLPHSILTSAPLTPPTANPDFEDPGNWTALPMSDDGSGGDLLAADGIFTATVPPQANRTLVRYRLVAKDSGNTSIRVPYADDPSLNFAYFVYAGVPDYIAAAKSVHPEGAGHVYPAALLTSLPVYHMVTRDADRERAYAYASLGNGSFQLSKGSTAREIYNWECALVHDGIVYDHVAWRLRQNNDRYAGDGKRSMRFRMNRGHYFQARDEYGKKLPNKWRRLNTSKMSRFGGSSSYGVQEYINARLWRMVGVECPRFSPAHFRMVDSAEEAPDQYNGDFFGLAAIIQDIDGQLLDEVDSPSGNIYKLKDGESDPFDLERNQGRSAVTDASDFSNIKSGLNASQTESWLREHVDWDQWYRYHTVLEAVRHWDLGTTAQHLKNQAWYFLPSASSPLGLLRMIPHDHDASWSKGYHDELNLTSAGVGIGTDFPWAAIFGGIARPHSSAGEKSAFTVEYRNFMRSFRDILWNPETVETMINEHIARLQPFTLADRDRWTGGPTSAGVESMNPVDVISTRMKNFAFSSETMLRASITGGRAVVLDQLSADAAIPETPAITYSGAAGFPVGSLAFTTSSFADPQGASTFGKIEWRIAEIAEPATLSSRKYEWSEPWVSGEFTSFQSRITPPAFSTKAGLIYRARVRHADTTGRWSHWSEPLQFTASAPDLALFTSSLVISEVMYRPAEPSQVELDRGFLTNDLFEYVELRNVGTQTIDLSNIRFTKGVDFNFAGSNITSLAPGGYALVVNDLAAFTQRYGAGKPIAGQVISGKLNNIGEQIKLSFGAGETIRDFTYSHASPWPVSAGSGGISLVLVDPFALPSHSDGMNWRASTAAQGTPGATDGTVFAGGTAASFLIYATGNQQPRAARMPNGTITYRLPSKHDAEDLIREVQLSTDLQSWIPADAQLIRIGREPVTVTHSLEIYTATIPAGRQKCFLRMAYRKR